MRVALIGAGKFGSMFLSQARRTPGIHVVAVADLEPERARACLARVGWPAERYGGALARRGARERARPASPTTRWRAIAHPAIEIVIDATGNPAAGIAHALACCAHGKHIVMVNVEADALAGPLLARARARGRHRLFARLRRPARAHLRDGRLGARRGLRGRRRGQGHQVPARVPRLDARHRVGPLRLHAGEGGAGRLQRADVQLVPRRHQDRRSRWRRSRTRPGSRRRPTGLAFPPCGVDDLPRVLQAARRRRRAAPPRARSRSSRAWSATAGRSSATCAGASTSRSPPTASTCAAASSEYGLVTDETGRLRGDVQAVSPDRARARHLGRERRAAPRADGRADRLSRRRASPSPSATSRPARRSTAKAATPSTAGSCRRGVARRGGAADRARARREAHARRRRGRDRALGRRRLRRVLAGGEVPPRDGKTFGTANERR